MTAPHILIKPLSSYLFNDETFAELVKCRASILDDPDLKIKWARDGKVVDTFRPTKIIWEAIKASTSDRMSSTFECNFVMGKRLFGREDEMSHAFHPFLAHAKRHHGEMWMFSKNYSSKLMIEHPYPFGLQFTCFYGKVSNAN